jgi:hypothetical protein
MLEITPGKEEEFRYLRGWLAGSDWLDRLIEASESRARGNGSGEARRRNGYWQKRRGSRAKARCRRGRTGRWFRRASVG